MSPSLSDAGAESVGGAWPLLAREGGPGRPAGAAWQVQISSRQMETISRQTWPRGRLPPPPRSPSFTPGLSAPFSAPGPPQLPGTRTTRDPTRGSWGPAPPPTPGTDWNVRPRHCPAQGHKQKARAEGGIEQARTMGLLCLPLAPAAWDNAQRLAATAPTPGHRLGEGGHVALAWSCNWCRGPEGSQVSPCVWGG